MIRFDKKQKIYYSTLINDNNYFSGFSTKRLGTALKESNIFRFLDRAGAQYKKIITLRQIHSANVEFISKPEESHVLIQKIEDTDGVLTDKKETVLTVKTADCVPILFIDKQKGIVGASHVGWRGTIKKLPLKMIQQMLDRGSQLSNIYVAIGPSIGNCCYEVKEDVLHHLVEELENYLDKVITRRFGRVYLNLILLNFLLLREAGIKKENIDFFPFCTCCNEKAFFSYRREGKGLKGEMFSFIIRK